ncbi:MAG TPA: hypothetical protein VHV75_09920 [Solirubrobacteraceae bacterium]|jgi:hypothetical protein|nr:hypothetical protein [Solirubrobacteraceae bacterium]
MSATQANDVTGEATVEQQGPSFTDGLRALADLLDANPQIDTQWRDYRFILFVGSSEELARTAVGIGGQWEKSEDHYYCNLDRSLGGGVGIQVTTARGNVCERVQVGTETVMVPAPDAPMVEEERPVYEWKCPESLLGVAR